MHYSQSLFDMEMCLYGEEIKFITKCLKEKRKSIHIKTQTTGPLFLYKRFSIPEFNRPNPVLVRRCFRHTT